MNNQKIKCKIAEIIFEVAQNEIVTAFSQWEFTMVTPTSIQVRVPSFMGVRYFDITVRDRNPISKANNKIKDQIDGYDRDDLGESPDC